MCKIPLFRERFFCLKLRTACFIYGLVDLAFLILYSVYFIFFDELGLNWGFKGVLIAIGVVLVVPLFIGIILQSHQVLWIFVGISTALCGILSLLFCVLLLYVFYAIIFNTDNEAWALAAAISIIVIIVISVLMALLPVQTLVVRSYQVQLHEREEQNRPQIAFESGKFI